MKENEMKDGIARTVNRFEKSNDPFACSGLGESENHTVVPTNSAGEPYFQSGVRRPSAMKAKTMELEFALPYDLIDVFSH